nr:hypothetical protein [Brevibacterium antiquum]
MALVIIDTTVKKPTDDQASRTPSPRALATTAATVKTRIERSTTIGTAGRNGRGIPAQPAAAMRPVKETAKEATATSTASKSAEAAIDSDSGLIRRT